jgi:hypothetical protein
MITNLKIDSTDIILQDFELGQGKITISNSKYGVFSYQWNSMGSNLKDFLLRINSEYFMRNLSHRIKGEIDIKKTMTYVRKYIRKEYRFFWYMDLKFQKQLRERLNDIQNFSYSDMGFVNSMQEIKNSIDWKDCEKRYQYEAENTIIGLSSEPWHFIINKEPVENIWLFKLFNKLQKKLREI